MILEIFTPDGSLILCFDFNIFQWKGYRGRGVGVIGILLPDFKP